jgi:phage protein D
MMVEDVNVGSYAPGFKLAINGMDLDPIAAHSILSLRVDQELDKTNSFTIEIQDEFKGGHFNWLESNLFSVGNTVTVSMGYTNNLVKLLIGKIKNLTGSFNTGCLPTFTVEGMDKSYDILTTPSETKVFSQKQDSDIANEIAQMAGLEPAVDSTDTPIPVRMKAGGKTYLEFLQRLAQENDYEFFLGGRRLHFRKMMYQSPIRTLTWGKDLIRFEPQLNTTSAVTQIIVRGWDAKNKKQIEGRAQAGSETSQESNKTTSSQMIQSLSGDVVKVITNKPVKSVDEANRLAKSELDKAGNNLCQATVDTVGMPDLTPGICVNIQGFGTMFSGQYYIVKASHTIDGEGYRTSLNVRRNAV